MDPVGHLINFKDELVGKHGMFYDYVYAGNGVFIQAEGPLLVARIAIAPVNIRGLAPVDRKVELVHGKIPSSHYDLALSILFADRFNERYLAVTWEDGEYHLTFPWQEGGSAHVNYEVLRNTVMDIHSHSDMKGSHSPIDNRDEQGFRLSAVIGKLNELLPEQLIRITVFGYYDYVKFEEVFDV